MEREPAVVVPNACTLPPESNRPVSPTRLDVALPDGAATAEADELLRREAECCSFFGAHLRAR